MDLLDLFVKIGVKDETSEGISNISSKLKSGFSTAGKVAAAGIGVAVAAVGTLTKASLEGYAAYEQLTGGVETLFKSSANTVMQYADNAYKTAGMSANAYMETVTSFSASLLQGLNGDTAAAAKVADQAITDMADNANKMGTSMEMIQNAYQGFAKQNYDMLDNLKLGYGGTASEMARLINDSGVLGTSMTVTAETVNQVSFDKMIEAIHVVQTEMGISGITAEEAAKAVASGAMTQEEAFAAMGTTAKEASTTIEGSVSSAKAAWSNLVTGIADDNADMDTLVTNFVDSIGTAAENILPRVQTILGGIGDLVAGLAPVLAEQIPVLITQVLPSMLNAGTQLLSGLLQGLTSSIPQLVDAAVQVATSLAQFLVEQAPTLLSAASQLITSLVQGFYQGFPSILDSGMQILNQLATGIENGLPNMVSKLPKIIDSFLTFITSNLPKILDQGVQILTSLINGIIKSIPKFVKSLPEIIKSFVSFIKENLPKMVESGIELLINLVTGIISAIPELIAAIPQIIGAIVQGIMDLIPAIIDAGKKIVEGIWNGISSMASWLWEQVSGFFSGIVNGVKDMLGIHSPSRVFADIGRNMALGMAEGVNSEKNEVQKAVDDLISISETGMSMRAAGLSGGKTLFGSWATPRDFGAVSIQVNAAPGQDEGEIARRVMDLLEIERERREAAFA